MNIGYFGGRFDPVHFGHLGAAEDAFIHHRLDRVVFVPTAQVPHQSQRLHAAADDRLAMLRQAIITQPKFEVSEFELGQCSASYTFESVRHFRHEHPKDRLYWIMGSDQLSHLHIWKNIRELVLLIEFIVLVRPGHPQKPPADIPGLRLHDCPSRWVNVSSTALRDHIKNGHPLTTLTPGSVADYIAHRDLYR